jgi:hypothetical protein
LGHIAEEIAGLAATAETRHDFDKGLDTVGAELDRWEGNV